MIIEITKSNILYFTGSLVAITGWFDAYKYHVSAQAIRKAALAKGHSRRFINYAIGNDLARIIHCILLPDWWLVISSIIVICCVSSICRVGDICNIRDIGNTGATNTAIAEIFCHILSIIQTPFLSVWN